MASSAQLPYKMHVAPANTGLWGIQQTDEAAQKTSELLQEDLEKHHVFFNDDGFHNHIPHHLLALYGTGAGPAHLAAAYANNCPYQRPALPPHNAGPGARPTFRPWPAAAPYLGREEFYPDFMRFFQAEMRRLAPAGKGEEGGGGAWQAVVSRYLLDEVDEDEDEVEVEKGGGGGRERRRRRRGDMLARLFAGLLHPLIQLMYGVEWGIEAVVAEGLAETAVHSAEIGEYLFAAEEAAAAGEEEGEGEGREDSRVSIMELVRQVAADERLARAARMEDANKIRDGVLARARDEMVRLAARVRVRPDEVEERAAEMFDACVFVAAAAALVQPRKQPKFDFFLMHHVNASPFFVTLNAQDWVPRETKARLLEWKIRMDLLQYAARGVPALSFERLATYQPRKPGQGGSLADIVTRLHGFPDDGHAIKLGRAAVICRDVCKRYEDEGKDWLKVKGDDMWNNVCHLIVDSVEAPGAHWVRSCGFEEAWKDIPDIQDPRL